MRGSVSKELHWVEKFATDGFYVFKNFLKPDVLNTARRGLTKLVDRLAARLILEGKVEHSFSEYSFETRLLELCQNCPEELPHLYRSELHEEEFFPLLCNPDIIEVLHVILPKATDLRIYPNYTARPKTPDPIHEVTWHQDACLRSDGGPSLIPADQRSVAFGPESMVNLWTPLVPAREDNGAMLFVPGSHKLGLLEHVNVKSYEGLKAPESETGGGIGGETSAIPGTYMTGVREDIIAPLREEAIPIECDPGDVVFFSNMLIHRGGVNRTNEIRWSFDWRYQDAAQPTLRDLEGHIVSSRTNNFVQTPQQWASLSLS